MSKQTIKIILRVVRIIFTYQCVLLLLLAVWDYKPIYLKLIFTCAFINFLISEYLKDDDNNNDHPSNTKSNPNKFQQKLNQKMSESWQ